MHGGNRCFPCRGLPAADDIMLQRDVPLEKGGPDPQKEDRVMLNRNRVSRIYFDQKFYDYPIQLKPELFMNMGFLQTMQVGFSYLASLIHKRPENSLEDFYINRFGKKLYSMFFEHYTENLWGTSSQGYRSQLGCTARKGTFHYCDFKKTSSGKSYRPKSTSGRNLPDRILPLSQARSRRAVGRNRFRNRKAGRQKS